MTISLTSNTPHIRSAETVPKIYWGLILSLLPALAGAMIFGRWRFITLLGCSVAAAMLAEVAAKKIFSKPTVLHDGVSILMGILFALLCPLNIGLGAVVFGIFLGIGIAKECFGGTGQYLFHPALVGLAFLQLMTAGDAGISNLLLQNRWMAAAFLAGGIFITVKRIVFWEVPLLYLLVLMVLCSAVRMSVVVFLNSGIFYLAAFYLVTDFSTTPLTRSGGRIYAVLSAFLTIFLFRMTSHQAVFPFALLLANAVTPWIDSRIRPKNSRNAL